MARKAAMYEPVSGLRPQQDVDLGSLRDGLAGRICLVLLAALAGVVTNIVCLSSSL